MTFTRLPAWITEKLPMRLVERDVYALVVEGVCGLEAKKRVMEIAAKYGIPREENPQKQLLDAFRQFGGLIIRKDYCNRAARYLEHHHEADAKELRANLLRGMERREIERLPNPYIWYYRRVQAFRKKRAGK